jgi:hypothetical protein
MIVYIDHSFSGDFMKLLFRRSLGVLIAVSVLFSDLPPARATDQTDLIVGLKALPLLNDKIRGATIVAVIYDPTNADSRADAELIKSAVDANPNAPGGAKLSSLMVAVGDLGKLSSAKIAFVARGVSQTYFNLIASAATGVLTISTNLDCVKASRCVLGVVSRPSVEIYFSQAAADAARISFAQAFTMLTKKI